MNLFLIENEMILLIMIKLYDFRQRPGMRPGLHYSIFYVRIVKAGSALIVMSGLRLLYPGVGDSFRQNLGKLF